MWKRAGKGIGALQRLAGSRAAKGLRRITTRHLHGPRRVRLSDTDVMVVLLTRDGEYFVEEFIRHHLGIGARHILVIDNGSRDGTLEICRRYERVTVMRNRLPAKVHESGFRTEIAQRVAQGGWFLFADSDELAEVPTPAKGPAKGAAKGVGDNGLLHMTRYCNAHGYTAVLGHMLDRFSALPYEIARALDYRASIAAMDLYSLNRVNHVPYADGAGVKFSWFLRENLCADPQVGFRTGGLRTELFGELPFLSKHSLVRNVPGLVPMSHPHCASRVRIADVTLLLHHYKLAGDWMRRDSRTVEERRWDHGEDARRLDAVAGSGQDYRITPAQPRSWRGVDALVDEGFLYASPRFRATLAAEADVPPATSSAAPTRALAAGVR